LASKFPKIDPACRDNEPMEWAARSGQVDVLAYLVSLKSEFPRIDVTPFVIRSAVGNNRISVVKYLFSLSPTVFEKLDPAFERNWPIRVCAEKAHLEMLQYFISLKPIFPRIDPADRNNGALISAAKNGHLSVVTYLVSLRDVGFSEVDPKALKNEPLRLAKMQGRTDVEQYLESI